MAQSEHVKCVQQEIWANAYVTRNSIGLISFEVVLVYLQ